LEERVNNIWTFRDARPVLTGEWPVVGGFAGPGGGVVTIVVGLGASRSTPVLDVYLGPDWARPLGAAWRVSPTNHGGLDTRWTNWQTAPVRTIILSNLNFSIEVQEVAWLIAPTNRTITINTNLNRLDLIYEVCPPQMCPPRVRFEAPNRLLLEGAPTTHYRIDYSPICIRRPWTTVSTGSLNPGLNEILVVPNSPTGFYQVDFWP
jgi:hypothetical protein